MRFFPLVIAAVLWIAPPLASPQTRRADEYNHKATFTLHFIRFTQWPEGTFKNPDEPIVMNVMYDISACEIILKKLDGEFVNQRGQKRMVSAKRVKLATDILTCHVFYFGSDDKAMIKKQLDAIGDRPILTIGETKGFEAMGGIINFDATVQKRFRVNITAAERAGLKLSSQLLRSAEIYKEPETVPGPESTGDTQEEFPERPAPSKNEKKTESWREKFFFHRKFKIQ